MTLPIVISFYTLRTPYAQEVQRLRASCERFGIERAIAAMEPRGSWERNCALKAPFIQDRLESLKRPVLWIDADGEIVGPISCFANAAYDLACHVRWSLEKRPPPMNSRTMPFMQPTGDSHGCERICGSPWLGREFRDRINQGRGPFWPAYNHYVCDRDLKLVAERLNVLWQRPELIQRHNHWSWSGAKRPDHMRKHRAKHFEDRELFTSRERSGFPGHEPILEIGARSNIPAKVE